MITKSFATQITTQRFPQIVNGVSSCFYSAGMTLTAFTDQWFAKYFSYAMMLHYITCLQTLRRTGCSVRGSMILAKSTNALLTYIWIAKPSMPSNYVYRCCVCIYWAAPWGSVDRHNIYSCSLEYRCWVKMVKQFKLFHKPIGRAFNKQ